MRKLASIRRISNISPISGADLIELAHVDGWQVVIKKGEFKKGDLCVYLEVDSWVPYELAPFLTPKDQEPKEFNGVKGNRLRTLKLKGCLSQGLVLPIDSCFPSVPAPTFSEGLDVSEVLNIRKWERPLPPELIGKARGTFPGLVQKTDLDRIQNLVTSIVNLRKSTWCVTEKLNGMSCTFYLDLDREFHVCSKDLDLLLDESNVYWKVALMYGVEELMREFGLKGIAIQGEVVGEGVCKNVLKVPLDFYVFSVYSVQGGTYLSPNQVEVMCQELGFKHVPIVHKEYSIEGHTISALLDMADGNSLINPSVKREGLVFRSNSNPNQAFKVISNKWLLKND